MGDLKDTRVVTHRILGHLQESTLERRLQELGETDKVHSTPTFGNIFWTFFRPHPNVQAEVEKVFRELKLQPDKYTAVHCRVRHPKAHPYGKPAKGIDKQPADRAGLLWEGEMKDFAISTATRALQCGATLPRAREEPVYFMSDSNDLVQYMAHELSNDTYVRTHASDFASNAIESNAKSVVSQLHVVSRVNALQNAHIDRWKGLPTQEYYGTFVDLLLGIHARCVTYGIGFYAVFAAKISGTSCRIVYAKETWGEPLDAKEDDTFCATDTHSQVED